MEKKMVLCCQCGGIAELTDWRPPDGMDPELRQYECNICYAFTYTLTTKGRERYDAAHKVSTVRGKGEKN